MARGEGANLARRPVAVDGRARREACLGPEHRPRVGAELELAATTTVDERLLGKAYGAVGALGAAAGLHILVRLAPPEPAAAAWHDRGSGTP